MSWIKMTRELRTAPEVVRIMSAVFLFEVDSESANCPLQKRTECADVVRFKSGQGARIVSAKHAVIGALHAVWCIADTHAVQSAEGCFELQNYTLELLDMEVGIPGFAAAMVDAGWLVVGDNCLIFPNFDRHNGRSAKRRAQDAHRKNSVRFKSGHDAQILSASKADQRREEKRREKKNPPKPPIELQAELQVELQRDDFARFWLAYPRRQGKSAARRAWDAKVRKPKISALVLERAVAYSAAVATWSDDDRRFIPMPATWINAGRWDDDPETWTRPSGTAAEKSAASRMIEKLRSATDVDE